MSEKFDVDAEVLAEEDAESASAQPTRVIDRFEEPAVPVLRSEVRTAAIAAAGGALAGAVTVAAVRVVGSAVGGRSGVSRRAGRRRERPANVVASRSFLVDVHLLGR